ncbi:RNA polymerase III subunit [Tieghemostelium lacteum]|uniref:RNA polymerase III subunit n=1 Tax=Tieghemostelium lacteum TaxID=361077 RepID=A0A151Z743_TIELA|nr:RNA polymerase III subunit [Tieghemostelium lacteum]|eukprot:KYQ89755.1 RNA polymerase III subunit [Tieghemostelium lacteum]
MSNNNTEEQQVPGSASPTLTGKKQNRSQPEWIKPSEKQVKPLMINNSLTTSKVPFVPLNPDETTLHLMYYVVSCVTTLDTMFNTL